jgi:tetratricopeptide (TPR) repeat protein
MENTGLIGDILALLGAFFLGFVAGALFGPLRHFVVSLVRTPGQVFKGAQNASAKLLQAFRTSAAEEELDRSGLSGALAGAISGVLTVNVRRAETSFREGMAAFDQGELDLAQRRLSEAIFWDRRVELAPMHVLAHLRLGGLDEQQGAWDNAKKHYQRAAQLDANDVPAAVHLGMVHFQLGETGPAIFQFQRALELDPANLDTHYYLYTVYRRAKMESEALEQLRIIKAGEPAEKLVELFARHGADHFRMAAYPEAASDYELALQLDPDSIPLYLALGDLYHLQGQLHTALETWCRGLWIGYSDALAERVLAVAGEAVDVWPVITLVRDCVARHPEDGRQRFLLSRLLRGVGQEEERVVQLQQAAHLSPELLAAQEELGDLYTQVGDTARATLTYRGGLSSARGQETVYRCKVCAHVTAEEQERCFQCNRWGSFERMSRMEAEARGSGPRNLLQRAGAVRQSLQSAWTKIREQLPAPESRTQSTDGRRDEESNF